MMSCSIFRAQGARGEQVCSSSQEGFGSGFQEWPVRTADSRGWCATHSKRREAVILAPKLEQNGKDVVSKSDVVGRSRNKGAYGELIGVL